MNGTTRPKKEEQRPTRKSQTRCGNTLARCARGVPFHFSNREGGIPVSLIDVSRGTAYAGREATHPFHLASRSKHAQYFTPPWLADLLFEVFNPLIPPEGPASISVLDPTCGSGRLLAPFKAAGAQVLGIELDQLAADHARFAIGNQNVRTGDLLDYRHLLTNFSLVVTNPPYGIYWTPPDAGEVWTCETSGGLLESQGATLEIAARSLVYGGYLVAIVPTSTFENAKDRFLRDILYTQFEPVLQATLPNLFAEEYGIAVEVDLVIAKRTYRGHGNAWQPAHLMIDGDDGPGRLRYALSRALLDAPKLPVSTHAPVPVLSRLLAITPSIAVRVTPKGLKAAADVDGLLNFLDETVTAFDPVRGIEHGLVAATRSPASLLTLGPRAGVESLAWLGFDPAISERDQQTILRLQEKYRILKTPIYPPEAHQRLAYIEDKSYTAKATLTVDDEPCFTDGKAYHLRPSWIRNREVASVETVFDEREGKDVELITSVDRGYLAFQVVTDSGSRTFREVDAADVELLTATFELPDVSDLTTIVPARVAQHRIVVSRIAPFLFPFQQEDVARLAVKPFGFCGYEQRSGKTITAPACLRRRREGVPHVRRCRCMDGRTLQRLRLPILVGFA